MARPLILLSNDDGFDSAGLLALRAALSAFADVTVCAPRTNMSATSHALTLSSVLRLFSVEEATFAVDGTPADCVYVALHSGTRVLPRRPDMVVSGMNHGPNLGVDVVYSGTVAAAREGAQRGIPSVAVSADVRAHRGEAAALASRVIEGALRELAAHPAAGPTPLLNFNIPRGEQWVVRTTRLGERLYDDEVIYRLDPRGREYLWIGGANVRHTQEPDTDTAAWDAGEASLTALTLDLSETRHVALAARVANGLGQIPP
jgi:5'-nucleotidase